MCLHILELYSHANLDDELAKPMKAVTFIIIIIFFSISLLAGSWKFAWLALKANSVAILFFSLVSAEFINHFPATTQSPSRSLLFFGVNLGAIGILLILTKVPWFQAAITIAITNSYWWLRVRPEGFPSWKLSLYCLQIIIIAGYAYFAEKGDRKKFLQSENIWCRFKTYEEIMTGTMKNTIFFMRNDHLVFCNEFGRQDLGIVSDERALATLQEIKIIRRGGINEFLRNIDEKKTQLICKHTFTLYELYKDNEDYFLDLEAGVSPVFNSVIGELSVKEITKTFIIQLGVTSWNNEKAVMIIINDISHFKSYYNALDSQKDSVLATVSHDLRAPLNGMMGMLSLILEELDNESCREKLNLSITSAKLMQHMINDILDFSLISKGKLRLKFESTNVGALVEETVKLLSFQAKLKGLSLVFENLMKNSEQNHYVDGNRLRQVLFNLIGNAIKYTKKGAVIIRVMDEPMTLAGKKEEKKTVDLLEKMEHFDYVSENKAITSFDKIDESANSSKIFSHGKLVFEVEDTGIGIKQEDIGKLFSVFSRVTAGHDENMSGIGLGLAISQSLVMMMNSKKKGGKIKVKSVFGKGTLFRFPIFMENEASEIFKEVNEEKSKLPIFITNNLGDQHNPKVKSHINDSFKASFWAEGDCLVEKHEKKRLHILVVDDDQLNLLVASKFLNTAENLFTFKLATNGEQAIELFREQAVNGSPFDVVLMDCNMPFMNGYEATKQLKAMMKKNELQWTPVIALTGNSSETDKNICEEAGMDFFLSKPYKKTELFQKIQEAVSKKETFNKIL